MIEATVTAALHALCASIVLSLVLFGIVALVTRARPLDATLRHILWTIALCTTAIMPLVGFAVSAARAVTVVAADGATSTRSAGEQNDRSESTRISVSARTTESRNAASPSGERVQLTALAALDAALRPGRIGALVIVSLWLASALVGLIGLALSLNRVHGLKKRSSHLEGELVGELPWLTDNLRGEREIYLRLSFEIETPVAVGFRRPAILIPTELATQGGLRAIEGLVMHEHAHLRRRDDWTNLAQRVIERIFWFNPLVWALGRRIALEREIAADDAVVNATGQPNEYAQSLWTLAREMRMPEHSVVAPGALFTRKQISIRIEALLERRPVTPRSRIAGACTVALSALACTVAVAASAPALELPQASHGRYVTANQLAPSQPLTTSQVAPTPPSTPANPVVPTVAHQLHALPSMIASAISGGLAAGFDQAAAQIANAHDTVETHTAAYKSAAAVAISCTGCDLRDSNLRGRDLRGATFTGANLAGADLRGARLDGAVLIGVDLSDVQLAGTSLVDVTLTGTNISGTSFQGTRTRGLRLSDVSLADEDLHGLDVRAMLNTCKGCDLANSDLRGADLHGDSLVGANFADADLTGADLSNTNLNGANFDSANLKDANLRNAKTTGTSFADANLSGADTTGTSLKGSDL